MSGLQDILAGAEAISVSPLATFIQLALSLLSVESPNLFGNTDEYPQYTNITDGAEFDIVIVGGGTAGCVLAKRLSEIADWSVLLIEAGGDPPIASRIPGLFPFVQRSKADWGYYTKGNGYSAQAHTTKNLHIGRGKTLGGTSALEYMCYTRGNKHDFEKWVELGNAGWDWDTVLYYYKKSERQTNEAILNSDSADLHGTDGPLPVTRPLWEERTKKFYEAFKDNGRDILVDYNGYTQLGYAPTQFVIYNNTRQSTAEAFLKLAAHQPNLYILKETYARKVVIEDNRAVGVEIKLPNGEIATVKARKEVILSAGTINSPQLLMLSGIGDNKHLEELEIDTLVDSPNVGENLQDIPVALVILEGAKDFSSIVYNADVFTHLGEFPNPAIMGFATLNKSQTYPDYQTINLPWPLGASAFPTVLVHYSLELDYKISEAFAKVGLNREYIATVLDLLQPESRGNVKLSSNNPEDAPIIDAGFYSNKNDLRRHALSIQDFFTVIDTPYFREADGKIADLNVEECADYEFASLEYWECFVLNTAFDVYNPVGTCAMGPDGVVDERLKVRGVDGLRVVDASVMPTSISGYVLSTVIMVAEKGADMIKIDNGIEVGIPTSGCN